MASAGSLLTGLGMALRGMAGFDKPDFYLAYRNLQSRMPEILSGMPDKKERAGRACSLA